MRRGRRRMGLLDQNFWEGKVRAGDFRQFLVFYFWTFVIPLVIAVLLTYYPKPFYPLHGGPFEFLPLLQETMANSGVTLRGGGLIPLLRSVAGEPVLVIAVLGSAIPALVAIALSAFQGGGALLRLIGRLRPWLGGVKAKEGLVTWIILAISVIAIQLASFALKAVAGISLGWTVSFNPALFTAMGAYFIFEAMFLNQGGLLEELGFRGYAQPALQSAVSPIAAALILGVCWAIWHVSRDILFLTVPSMGLFNYALVYMPLFTIWCVGGSIVMAYFVNRTGGSALAAIAVHGFLNDGAQVSGVIHAAGEIAATPEGNMASMVARAVVVGAAGLFTFLIAGKNLGLHRSGESKMR